MTIKTTYILTILTLTCGLLVCGQNTAFKETNKIKSEFSLSITTYNHAEQIYNGIAIYTLIKDTLTIHRNSMFYDYDTILFSKKLDNYSIDQIESIQLDSLEDFYFNNCVMTTSGNEYFVSRTNDTITKQIHLHHYYEKQIEILINELNKQIPESLKIHYMTSATKQDCK